MLITETDNFDQDVVSVAKDLPGVFYRSRYEHAWTMSMISESVYSLTGFTADELIGNHQLAFIDLIHPDDAVYIRESIRSAVTNHHSFSFQYRIKHRDGSYKPCWEQGVACYAEDGEPLYIQGYIADLSAQHQHEEQLECFLKEQRKELALNHQLLSDYKAAVDHSAIVSKANTRGEITYVNDEFCRISGFSREELLGATHSLVRHPDSPRELFESMWSSIAEGKIWKGVIKNRSKAGETYYVNSTIVPFKNELGQITEYMSIRHDVTNLFEQETLIQKQNTDALTGLPNRQRLLFEMQSRDSFSLAIINIIDFSEVNEYYGYRMGDKLLQRLAVLLERNLDQGLHLYRLAGDEFAILSNDDYPMEKFSEYCQKLIRWIDSTAVDVEGQEFNISIAVGLASGIDAFVEADIALHNARQHQQSFEVFDADSRLKRDIESNIRWVKSIRNAIRDGRIETFAQPIFCAKSRQVKKYECLMRLREEDGSVVTPYFFLEAAKRARLYTDLTRIIIRDSFTFFSNRDESFSINLTARDILHEETADYLLYEAQRQGVADQLILELVESEGIENFEKVSSFIAMAKSIGCRIAVDDFGTGYSNFEYLLKLDIDFIKLDGSLIRCVDQDQNARIVAETIIHFAKRLELQTIAEFVHSEAVQATVTEMGVDYLQGFLLGEPTSLSDLE